MKSLVEVADMTNDVEIKLIAVECLLKKNTEITAQNKQRTQREIDMILGKAVMDINVSIISDIYSSICVIE